MTLGVLLFATEAYADDAKLATPAETSAASAPADGKVVDKDSVYLHVASSATVFIENSETGEVVCTSPCDKRVPAAPHYRIGGVRPSPDFTLAAPSGQANVRVRAGSKTSFWMGVGALSVGTLVLGTGIGILVYGVNNRNPVGGADSEDTDNTFTDRMALGTALTILGTVSALWGGAAIVTNASTKVRGDLNTAQNDGLPRRSAAASLVAPFRTLPKPLFVPLLQGTF